jgi:hypothetical protein
VPSPYVFSDAIGPNDCGIAGAQQMLRRVELPFQIDLHQFVLFFCIFSFFSGSVE